MLKRSKPLLLAAVSVVGLPSIAVANDHIDEVIVEAPFLSSSKSNSIKTPTPILDVPQSLSIITAEQIAAQGFTSIGDLIDYTPGVNTSQGEGHRDAVVFRGVRSTADFYIDGVRDDVQYYRPLYNLDQVEILRGPNALLFGRGGTGGILNRVTKKGEIGEDFTGYGVSVDSFGEYSLQVDQNTTVSDTSAFRFNAYYSDLNNHRDFYDGERIGLNPTMRFVFDEKTTVDVSYEYIDHERFIDRGIPTGADGRPVEDFEDIVFGDPELNLTTLEAHVFRVNVEHQFSDSLKGNFSAHYGDYDKLYQNFYVPNSVANGDSGFDEIGAPDQAALDGYVDTTDRQSTILSANLVNEFSTGDIAHTFIAGVEYIDTSSDQDRFNAVWTPDENIDSDTEIFMVSRPLSLRGGEGINVNGTPITNSFSQLNDDTRVDVEVQSLFVQDEISVTEQFDVVLGARFDKFDIEVFNAVPTSLVTLRQTDEEISPRAGLIYKPKENISIYASYSESFLPRSGEQFASISDENLDPDVFENQEVGFKWDLENGLSLTAAYFENEQTRTERDNLTSENFDVRGLEIDGYEIELKGQLSDSLSVIAGYTSLDGRTADGEDPRELPENMASLWTTYQATNVLGFGFGATYQDKSLINDGGSQTLPSYVRVDAAAYYDVSDKVRVQLNLENLTDELYFPNAHATHQATVGAPFNASFTISGRL